MKNIITTIAAIVLLTAAGNAANLIVEQNGAGGALTSISTALNLASDGDRILVYPKTGGLEYYEDLTITHANLQILSAVSGQKFNVTGAVKFNGSGSGTSISDAVIHGNTTALTNDVHLANCTLYGTFYGTLGFNNLDACSVLGSITISTGRIAGCHIVNSTATPAITIVNPFSGSHDTTFIVGNYISCITTGSPTGISLNASHIIAYVANNSIEVEYNGSGTASGYGINVIAANPYPWAFSAMLNNTVVSTGHHDVLACYRFALGTGGFDIENNMGLSQGTTNFSFASAPGPLAKFNYNMGNHGFSGYTPNNTNNGSCDGGAIVGGYSLGTNYINGGNPGEAYIDIDLTRNDVGCTGGSYHINNFSFNSTYPAVLFMKSPRVVMLNQTFNINAEGLAK